MSRFTRIFDMLDIIFGKGFMSKNIGKRTNVITLPDENSRRLLTKELAIDKAPDSAIQQGKKDLEKLALDIPKLNDQELLTLTNNAERLAARINPKEFIKRRQRALPKADVIEFANKEKISPEGVMSLTEKIGQKNAPGTLMGNLESRIKQLEASGEDLSKMKGSTLDELMSEVGTSQKGLPALQREGLVRATARDIMIADINSGKLKLPKELVDDILGGGGEPINFFRQFYGEDALEVLDSLSPDFSKLRTSREAADFAKSKFAFEPDLNRPAGSMSVDDAIKAEKEFGINKPKQAEITNITAKNYRNADPDQLINEYNKNLNLLSQVDKEGGTSIGYEQFNQLQNRNKEIENILDSIGIKSAPEVKSEGIIIPFKKKPEDLEGFAKGGTVSKGLDYLTGIERRGYANGDYVVQAGIKNYLGKQKTATVPIKWKSGKGDSHPDTELAYITKPEKELLIKLDMHNSMSDGEPNIGPGGLISLNSGGDGGAGGGTSGDTGGESGYTDYSDADIGPMGPQAGDLSYTDYRDEDMGPVGNYTMFDEATAKANLQSVVNNMKAKMTKDMDPLQRAAFNLSINNPFTSTFGKIGNFVLSPIGTILSSFSYNPDFAGDRKYTDYGNTSYFTGDERDGGGIDERKFIPSFDTTLLTPDLAKNRDYRLYQGSNNPFYSMQASPSGGISNVYTEFKKGGRVRMAGGGVSQGLDYLIGIERRGYQEGGESMVSPDDAMLSYDQAVEKSRQEQINKNALAQQKFNDYLKEKTGYGNIEDYYQDPGYQSYDPRAAEGDITKAIYDAINLQGYNPYGYDDNDPFQFAFDKDPNFFYTQEYDDEGRLIKRTPLSSEEKQKQIKNNLENALYDQSLYGFSSSRPDATIEGSKFFLDQLKNLQKRDPDFEKVIKEGKYIDALENKLRNLYDPGEYQKLQETLDPGYSKYTSDDRKINKAFDTSDVLANYGYKDGQLQRIDSSIYGYLSEGERDIIERSQSLPTYLTGYAQQLIQDARNRKQADQDRREQMLSQADQYASKQMISPENALTPEIPSNDVLDQWKAHAEATQAMKGEIGLDAIPEYGFQTGYDFQSKFPNLDPRIGAGLASGYQVLTEGLGMFNPNNPNFLNPAAAYKTALSDATKNIEGIMAFDQNLMTPEQQENRNKYLKSVGQNIDPQQLPYMDQYQKDYQTRISQVDPNALRNRYLENLQNTSSQDINQFQSQLRSNLVPRENQPQGLDYLTGN
jgi:hypothetical protein